jgi:hypothetical protein
MSARIFRQLAAFGLCILPLSALSQVPSINSAAAPPAISWHTANAITIPFEYFQQHIYISIAINGKPGFIFMLDSGANRNVLNLRTARQLGIELPTLGQSSNIGFGSARIYVGPLVNVNAEIDSIPVAHTMAVLDLNRFEQHFHHPTDGMLGYSFFRRFVVRLDFQKKLITLSPPEKYRYRGPGMRVRLKPSRNFIEMPVTVVSNRYINHEIDVVVDTGSNVTLVLYEHFVHPLDLQSSYEHAQTGLAFGLNGYYPIKIGIIDSLQLGMVETRTLDMDYLRDVEQIGPEKTLPGAIGNGILQSFRAIVFDVPQRNIFLEITPPPWEPGVQRSETFGP